MHFGSLLTAASSWLSARSAGGQWLLRIDDLDAPRCPPGAADRILAQLEAHGLTWDEAPRYQSKQVASYEATLQVLVRRGLTYPCSCTRAGLAERAIEGPDGPVYAGTCRNGMGSGKTSLRVRLPSDRVGFEDAFLGRVDRDSPREIGDFVVKRSDGQLAYQLACVVDDREQAITEVVRGADLLGSSLQQIALMRLLGQVPPRYAHLPLVVDAEGRKLSKQNHAAAIDERQASLNLARCAAMLGFPLPGALDGARPQEILTWLTAQWRDDSKRIAQRRKTITYNAVQQRP